MRLNLLILLFFLWGCDKRNCNDRYSGFELSSVDKTLNDNDWNSNNGYVKADNINFRLSYYYSSDWYMCKSNTMIHTIHYDSTYIYCSSKIVIQNDTISSYSNLNKYFEHLNFYKGSYHDYDVFKYKNSLGLPQFNDKTMVFHIILKLSDSKTISDSIVTQIY